MKILTVTGPLHREYGGPPVAATGVAASLAAIGHQVEVLVCGQTFLDSDLNSTLFSKIKRSGATVQVLRRRKESKYGCIVRLHELKSVWNAVANTDFVILHQVFELQYLTVFPILLLLKKPFTVMPHGTLTTYQRKQHRFRKFPFSLVTYLFLKSAKGIFVATEQEKKQLPRYLKGKGITVGLGIDLPQIQFQKTASQRTTFNLLYMGRIAKKKRLDIALQAVALVIQNSNLQIKFLVCGSGEKQETDQIEELVKDLQIEAVVEFRGWVDFDQKQEAFAASDCFILTSEDENFAIAAGEALANGIPCILSSNVALSTLVSKHSAGIVFDQLNPLEIMNAIIAISKFDREVSRSSSLQAVSEITWDRVAIEWDSSIRLILRS